MAPPWAGPGLFEFVFVVLSRCQGLGAFFSSFLQFAFDRLMLKDTIGFESETSHHVRKSFVA